MDWFHWKGKLLLNDFVAGTTGNIRMGETYADDVVRLSQSELTVNHRLFCYTCGSFVFGARDLRVFLRGSLQIVSSIEEEGGGERSPLWTLFACEKPSGRTVKCLSLAVLSLLVRSKLATVREKRGDENAQAGNVAVDIVDCAHRLILELNTSL